MSINRFDTSVRPNYISSHIQLPFQELAGLAANHQKEYDTNVDNAYKLKDFMSTIPEVNDPMLKLDNTKAKKAIDNEYAPVLTDLSTRIVNGNDPNAIRELTLLQRKIQNDPRIIGLKNQRAQYEAYKSDITKKAGKYDARLDDYAGTQLVDDSGNPLPFNYHGMEDSLDREKKFREAMGDFKESTKGWDIESLGADGIKIGQKGQRSGITVEQVMNVAKNKVGTVLNNTDEGKQFVKILKRTNPNITNEQILDEATKAMFSTASNQIFTNNTDGNTVDPTIIWSANRKAADDKVALENALRPSTLDGATQNAISSDGDFNSLFKNEIFTDKNGIVTFNPKMLTENPAVNQSMYTGSMGSHIGGDVSVNNKTTAEKSEMLVKQLKKMAKATGKDYSSLSKDGKLDTNAVTQLASAYNQLSKSRSLDLIMSPAVQSSESEYANLHWRDLKQVNPNKPEQSIAPEPLGENQEVVITNRRTDKNGKMYQEGYIRDKKTGEEIKPVTYRSNMTEKNLVFDAMGSMQKASIDNLSEDNYLQDKSGKDLTVVYNGTPMKIFKEENIGGGKYIQGITNPNDKRQVIYTVRDKNTNKILSTERSNLAELKKDIEEHYYTNTLEGNTELENLKSLMKQGENQQGE